MHCQQNTTEGIPTHIQLEMNIIVSFIIATISILGNLIIMIMFFVSKSLQNMNNAAVTLLSVSDMLRGCLMISKLYHQILILNEGDVAPIREPLCTLTAVVYSFTIMYSPMLLALIAVVRYHKFKPNNFGISKITQMKFGVINVFIVTVGVVFSALPILGFGNFRFSRSHGTCFVDWCDDNSRYRIVFYGICCGVVFPTLCCCYGALIRAINIQGRNMLVFQNNFAVKKNNDQSQKVILTDHVKLSHEEGTVIANNHVSKDVRIKETTIDKVIRKTNRSISVLSNTSSQMEIQVYRREKRLARILIIIFATYVLCWIPATILNIVALTDRIHIQPGWFYLIVTLVEFKSAIDPLLYGFGNKSYWKIFRRFLRSIFRSRKKSYTL